jgi:hypothetical protein
VPPEFELPHAVIDPSALRVHVMEAQAHPLIMAIPRFIQLEVPLPPLKPMALRAAKAPLVE